MLNVKKIVAVLLVMCTITGMVSGCTASKKTEEDNTLTINMWATTVPQIIGSLRQKFPDINFVVNEYAGANSSLYLKELLQNGEGGDIFFYTTFYNDSDAPTYLADLSGYPFLANYDRAILSTLDVDGAIYQIPGPITVRYVAVNKTLFAEKGWNIPKNFDEVIDVCKQIREEEPEIVPLGLGMGGLGFVWTLVTSYAQMGFLDTAEGQAAAQNYLQGTASFGDAFGEGLDMVARLVDAGAFMPEKFVNTWDVTPKQMGDREAAMCYVMGSNALYTELFSGRAKGNPDFGKYNNDEFIALPMYGNNEKNKGLILGTINTWGINKRLEEKGNENKLKNALRVLEYISSEEGQLAIRSDPASIPAIKKLNTNDVPEFMRNLWNDSTNSIKRFFLYTGYEHILTETANVLVDAMWAGSSEGMKEKFIRIADQLNNEFLNHQSISGNFGYAEENLSVEQTRKVSCEAIRKAAKADIAIASEAGSKNGVINSNGLSGKLFKGDIVQESLTVILALKNATVVYVPLLGKEVRNLLEKGKIMHDANGTEGSFDYWASGIDVIRKDGKVTDIKADGRELDDTAIYKVAMLQGDYAEAFAESHEITDTGVGVLDALETYFRNQGRIKGDL